MTGLPFWTERALLLGFATRAGSAHDRGDHDQAAYWTDCATWARNALARCLDMDAE